MTVLSGANGAIIDAYDGGQSSILGSYFGMFVVPMPRVVEDPQYDACIVTLRGGLYGIRNGATAELHREFTETECALCADVMQLSDGSIMYAAMIVRDDGSCVLNVESLVDGVWESRLAESQPRGVPMGEGLNGGCEVKPSVLFVPAVTREQSELLVCFPNSAADILGVRTGGVLQVRSSSDGAIRGSASVADLGVEDVCNVVYLGSSPEAGRLVAVVAGTQLLGLAVRAGAFKVVWAQRIKAGHPLVGIPHLRPAMDLDGDGIRECLVYQPAIRDEGITPFPLPGSFALVSGTTGKTVTVLQQCTVDEVLSLDVDADGDGKPDLCGVALGKGGVDGVDNGSVRMWQYVQ